MRKKEMLSAVKRILLSKGRSFFVLILGLVGTAIFLRVMGATYPVKTWLACSLGMLWGWCLFLSLACMSFGHFLYGRVFKLEKRPMFETAVYSIAVGVVAFVVAMYIGGAMGWFKPAFAIALPAVFLVVGARDGMRRWLESKLEEPPPGSRIFDFLVAGLGVLAVGLLYLGLLSPHSVNYDASWYHLRMAQDYARFGRIMPFYDWSATVPHLASILYTWGYLVPGLSQPERWMMALHIEFSLLLWTLVGVSVGIRRLVEDDSFRGGWVAFFLFPIIFVYDNNLGSAADHVLAFFSVPIALATVDVLKDFNRGRCALLTTVLAGAVLTKYQAIYLIVPVCILVGGSWLGKWFAAGRGTDRDGCRAQRKHLLQAMGILWGLGLLLVSPHFLKNLIFFHNPVYPFLQDVIPSRPSIPFASLYVKNVFTDTGFIPRGSFWLRAYHAVELFFTFSFQPHYSFTKNVPSFGSLFTLLLPGILVVQGKRALAVFAFIGTMALLVWGMTYNVDRNLQTFMPILVCVTGALVVKLWRLGWLARVGLIPLIVAQLVWGADAPFYSGHDRMKSAIDLARSGYEGRATTRFDEFFRDSVSINRVLPPNAKVLLHASHLSFGLDREVLQDMPGFQGLITYHYVRTPRELYDYFRSLGITHLLEGQRIWETTRQEQVLYNLLMNRYAKQMGYFGGYRLAALPDDPPPAEATYKILCLQVPGYAEGLYSVDKLTTPDRLPEEYKTYALPDRPLENNLSELLGMAHAVLVRGSFSERVGHGAADFESIPSLGDVTLYARRK